MGTVTTVYVCDNEEIKKRIVGIEKLKQKEGYNKVYINEASIMKPGVYLIMINEEEILSGIFVIKYAEVLRQLEKGKLKLVNACVPTQKGDALFEIFVSHFTGKNEIVRNELLYISSDKISLPKDENIKAYCEKMKLIWWAKETIEDTVNEILNNDFQYDMFLMPLYYEAERMRKDILAAKPKRQRRAFLRADKEDIEVSGIICDGDGKAIVALTDISDVKLTPYISEEKEYETAESILQDFISLAGDCRRYRLGDLKEALMKFYTEGLISYPITTQNFVNQRIADKMASGSELRYAAGISRTAFDYAPEAKRSQQAGGIMLLKNFSSFINKDELQGLEKSIIEAVIKRQSELAATKKIREEKIVFKIGEYFVPVSVKTDITASQKPKLCELDFKLAKIESEYEKMPSPCTIQRLITLLKVNAFPLEMIPDLIISFDESSFVNYYGGEYVIKRADREFLMNLPKILTDISFPIKVIDMAEEAAEGKISIHEFSENISEVTKRLEEELRKKEKQNEK